MSGTEEKFNSINPSEELAKIKDYLKNDYFAFEVRESIEKLEFWLENVVVDN